MDEPTEATISRVAPHLRCSLCEADCFDDHVQVSLGHLVVQVACPECANQFRHIFKLSLAAARSLRRRARELDEREVETEKETRG